MSFLLSLFRRPQTAFHPQDYAAYGPTGSAVPGCSVLMPTVMVPIFVHLLMPFVLSSVPIPVGMKYALPTVSLPCPSASPRSLAAVASVRYAGTGSAAAVSAFVSPASVPFVKEKAPSVSV